MDKMGLRTLVIIFVGFLFNCGGSSVPLHVPGNPDRVGDIYNSVVAMVKIENNNTIRGPYCTASFIGPRQLVTAAHCITHEDTAIAGPTMSVILPVRQSPIGDPVEFITFKQYNKWVAVADEGVHIIPEYTRGIVLAVDNENGHDVALLGLVDSEPASNNWLVMRDLVNSPLIPGEEAYSIGMPVGQIWVLTNGIISRIQVRRDGSVDILHQVRTGPGSSGSPIMDYRGRIVGIHSAGWSSRHSGTVVGEAKPISYIQTLIKILETQREIDSVEQHSLRGHNAL